MAKIHIYVALPVLNEMKWLPFFTEALLQQSFTDYTLVACVNQPLSWHEKNEKQIVEEDNQRACKYLNKQTNVRKLIIDRFSKNNAFPDRVAGVGMARKTAMDAIADMAGKDDIIVSMDADTTFGPDYFESIIDCFRDSKGFVALSNPYYHQLTDNVKINRAMLRYEIYLRYFLLQLFRIQSPYAFTALGSAIALPVGVYKKVRGMEPRKSGEDFYFLMKLRKLGKILLSNKQKVFPAARLSDRVIFGTGPALIKGVKGDWNQYPFYHHRFFNLIADLYQSFSVLFKKNIPTPADEFFAQKYGSADIWEPLRRNASSERDFIRACHTKFDALRIFQWLRFLYAQESDKNTNKQLFRLFDELGYEVPGFQESGAVDFEGMDINTLNEIRNFMMLKEDNWRKKSDEEK